MMNKIMKWTMLLSVLILAGCEQTEDLGSSVNSRWAGIVEEDFEQAYGYFSPGYKETETLESFKLRMLTAQINLRWIKGEFISANCKEEAVCEVKVKLDYKYTFAKRSLGGVDVETEVLENWIQLEDKWYLVPKSD